MFGSRKRTKSSPLKRLFYILMAFCGGGAGVGGWALKDHPRVQAIWMLVTGNSADATSDAPELDKSLVSEVVGILKPSDDFRKPGLFRVTINKVELEPALFKHGHTVDIQAKVHALDSRGRDTILWDSKEFGERLAVVGKDTLTAGWPNRPFQVEWSPGRTLSLQVYDRKTGLFIPPKSFTLASSDAAAGEFPFKTGDLPLQPDQKTDQAPGVRSNHIVLVSQRVGDTQQRDPAQLAERPIVIK